MLAAQLANLLRLLDTVESTLGAFASFASDFPDVEEEEAAEGRAPLKEPLPLLAFAWPVTAADPPVLRPTTPAVRDEFSDLAQRASRARSPSPKTAVFSCAFRKPKVRDAIDSCGSPVNGS